MTETTYYIDRDAYGVPTLWRAEYPGDGYPFAVTIDSEVLDLLRSLGVEDRTPPDWSHVEPGTAGTATVRGVEGVRVMRTRSGFAYVRADGWGKWALEPDDVVTDFTPDVVVDEALRSRVLNRLYLLGMQHDDRHSVDHVLRGES